MVRIPLNFVSDIANGRFISVWRLDTLSFSSVSQVLVVFAVAGSGHVPRSERRG
jgi:hypothetical protein